jgi:GNAT superfamily N-acetyltransferase
VARTTTTNSARERALQGDLAHRQVEVEDEAAGARLRPGFEALGRADTLAALRASRALIVRDEAGTPVGFASFGARRDEAEIEPVYVTESCGSRGIGGALVTAAARLAGGDSTWIIADDEGDSKRLYERLGFRPAWLQHVFTRRPG